MYVKPDIEAWQKTHLYCGKAISATYSECVFVDLGIQRAICMRHIVICGVPRCTIFFYTIS